MQNVQCFCKEGLGNQAIQLKLQRIKWAYSDILEVEVRISKERERRLSCVQSAFLEGNKEQSEGISLKRSNKFNCLVNTFAICKILHCTFCFNLTEGAWIWKLPEVSSRGYFWSYIKHNFFGKHFILFTIFMPCCSIDLLSLSYVRDATSGRLTRLSGSNVGCWFVNINYITTTGWSRCQASAQLPL